MFFSSRVSAAAIFEDASSTVKMVALIKMLRG